MNCRLAILLSLVAAASASVPAGADHTVVCESWDHQSEHCRVNTRGGVRLDEQLSQARCRHNDTWGYDRHGIWVSDGCRARFTVGASWSNGSSDSYEFDEVPGEGIVRCESHDNRRRRCPVETGDGVELSSQLSRARCEFGSTWGYDRQGIWVDDGCRGEFVLGPNGSDWDERRWEEDWDGDWFDDHDSRPGHDRDCRDDHDDHSDWSHVITCESRDGRHKYCRAQTRNGVRLSEQLSRARCQQGSSWGYDNGGIWVRNGCRAEFVLGRRH